VKRILRWFELCSGLKINFNKSSEVGINVDDTFCAGLAIATFMNHYLFLIVVCPEELIPGKSLLGRLSLTNS
jgi:hypothetical protein